MSMPSPLLLLTFAVVSTLLAVACGVVVFRCGEASSPRDAWNAPPRAAPVDRAMVLRLGATRERRRRSARFYTYAGALFWLAASVLASAASITEQPTLKVATGFGSALIAGAIVVILWELFDGLG
jgi:hypothetical protein